MRAVVCEQAELSVRELPDPVPGPGQLLLEVTRAGICGSDLHARRHADDLAAASEAIGIRSTMRSADAVVMGQEFSGPLPARGPPPRRTLREGAPVVAFPV